MTDEVSILNLGNLKAAADIAKTFIPLIQEAKSKGLDAQYAAELNGKIADMQFALIDAQSDALASQEAQSRQSARIKELEQIIEGYEKWEAEKARYKLVHISKTGGAFAYLLRKELAEEGEPLHYICPNCYNHRSKAILQRISRGGRIRTVCSACEAIYREDYDVSRLHGVGR